MKKAFILQARMGSSRLPKKILLPFFNSMSILDIIINKLKLISDNIILATSVSDENNILEEYAANAGIMCFRGDEDNVLQRFINASKFFNITEIIRVCSDNPFLDTDEVKRLYYRSNSFDYDYISFKIGGLPSIQTHYGFWAEYVRLDTLELINKSTKEKIFHEHVTNYIYTHEKLFNIEWLVPKYAINEKIRLTIDTEADFVLSQSILSNMNIEGVFPSTSSVVNYIEQNKDILNEMSNQIKLNTK